MKTTFLLLLLFPMFVLGQKIDNTASFRDMGSNKYFRFNYDNDYFASADRDYTQGYNFELAGPFLKGNPANFILLQPSGSSFIFGLATEHIGFSPNNIKSPDIQYGDRPFAAAIMLKSFLVASDTLQKSRVVSSFHIGIIGPGAFGKEMQVGIHKATGNTIPEGWQNQIKNDVVLNYDIRYEKELLRYDDFISVQGHGSMRLGTLFTNAGLGANVVAGLINSPFLTASKRKFALYAYAQPSVNVIAYDATLQGGLFNNDSPYVIADNAVKRFTAQYNYGIVLQTRTLYFEYTRTAITREFAEGHSSKWGGIRIGFTF